MAIYTASKTIHAQKWLKLRAAGWPIISSWIDMVGKAVTYETIWQASIDEVRQATAFLLYREAGEILEGALVEVGAALARGCAIHTVGCEAISFVHHPLVTRHENLEMALAALRAKADE